ncbi:MAG: hypothetical protein KDE56_07075 [Anaerolineales bacterium]|nr:hypothetical protein [Anaerolineales bacterium]
MTILSQTNFLKTLPDLVLARLPEPLRGIKVNQPYRWLIQFHYGEPRLHYEVSHAYRHNGWELGFHCEANDKHLNMLLLRGFRRHLFEIKDLLGEQLEAEMWDRGWTKIYEVVPERPLTTDYQAELGQRMAQIIIHLHPIYVEMRNSVAQIHR